MSFKVGDVVRRLPQFIHDDFYVNACEKYEISRYSLFIIKTIDYEGNFKANLTGTAVFSRRKFELAISNKKIEDFL